ncbi:hypothetical protein ACFJZ3_003436 [Vibrio vulnificus]|nr:hypothetical protein [Vibrio vulnificus]
MLLNQLISTFFPNLDFSDPDFARSLNVNEIAGSAASCEELLAWPPNVFIILYNWLEYTDKYRRLVSPEANDEWSDRHLTEAIELKNEWARFLEDAVSQLNQSQLPNPALPFTFGSKIQKHLQILFSHVNQDECLYDLCERGEILESMFILVSAIDMLFETFDWTGSSISSLDTTLKLVAIEKASSRGEQDDDQVLPSLADNHTKNGFVTLKTCVPQTGLTINNLTQHLSFLKPSVKPRVLSSGAPKSNTSEYRILVLPWPFNVRATDFKPSSCNFNIHKKDYFGFFDYAPSEKIDKNLYLKALISTIERYGMIDLVVFPECAMSESEFSDIVNLTYQSFEESSPCILSGVYGSDGKIGINKANLAFIDDLGKYTIAEQNKHHRWFLDRGQLKNYHLSGVLNPTKKLWENIAVNRRHLLTLHTQDKIKLCPLICEDLARQEPVAQAVRSIGANLVIALLLDGPQLTFRWPGKYAAVLSDDPGSSVLSVTALGMAQRSTGTGHKPSRTVALWSDQINRNSELSMEENGIGILIETDIQSKDMWTIDGRSVKKPILIKNNTDTIFEYCDSLKGLLECETSELVDILKHFKLKQEDS